jgi:hypothetical protein
LKLKPLDLIHQRGVGLTIDVSPVMLAPARIILASPQDWR